MENKVDVGKKVDTGKTVEPPENNTTVHPVAFLLPTYKTPLLTSNLLHTAHSCGCYADCLFVLLLDSRDPSLLVYKEIIDIVREKGLSAGYFIFDGTPYCGKINRVVPIINAQSFCVLDSTHLPVTKNENGVAGQIKDWLGSSLEPMKIGVFNEEGFYPVVTRKMIERLGYMFHPLAMGRNEAENWLLALGENLGLLGRVNDVNVIEAESFDGVEIEGWSDSEDSKWVEQTLEQILPDEVERLQEFLLK